jgi:inhibitor of KinA
MSAPAPAERTNAPFRILANGDSALVVEFGDSIDLAVNERVLALADRIADSSIEGIVEAIPTFRSLMISFDPLRVRFGAIASEVSILVEGAAGRPHAGRFWRLPVCYHPEIAPDLAEAASRTGMSTDAFIQRHSGVVHHVYMLGFLPGQPYLGDLPSEMALPRRETPRLKVASGSVGVASRMTCIFPKETPCGLNVIGRTPVSLWDPRRTHAALLAPGDSVTFDRVGLEDFARLAEQTALDERVLLSSGAAERAA